MFRFTLVGIPDIVHWTFPTAPDCACSHHAAEGQRQEISDEPGNEKWAAARDTKNDGQV